MSESLAHQTVSDAIARCNTLRAEATRIQQEQFRSSVPLAIAKLLERIAIAIDEQIREEWRSYSATKSQASLRQIYNWDAVVRTAGNHLRYLRGSTADRTPGTLARALDSLAETLGLEMQILLREKWRYNYSVQVEALSERYKTQLEASLSPQRIEQIFGDLGRPVYAVAFPAIERQSILLHAAFGHELGHLVVDRWIRDHDDKEAETGEAVRKRAAELQSQSKTPLLDRTQLVADQILKPRRRLLEEYAADMVGIELFGPAAFLAMTSIALGQTGKMDQIPSHTDSFYPPWRDRLRLAFESLRTAQWYPFPAPPLDVADYISLTSSRLNDAEQIALEPTTTAKWPNYIRIANELALEALPRFRVYLLKLLENYPNRVSLLEQSYQLALRLSLKLRPNDCGNDPLHPQPPHLASILNGGWLYRIGAVDSKHEIENDYCDKLGSLQKLVLKGIEDAVLLSDFENWRSEL